MKIQKFNEEIEDDLSYDGSITIKFNISRKKIKNYTGVFSDNELKNIGIDGVIERYVFNSLDKQYINQNFNQFEKIIDFDLYDKDGTLIGKDIFDDSKKYNL